MAKKYGRIQNVPIYIMDKATKADKKLPKGYVIVQSLLGGQTAKVPRTKIKNISTKYPKLKR